MPHTDDEGATHRRSTIPFSWVRLAAIGENAMVEAVRQRVIGVLLILSGVVIAGVWGLRVFCFGSPELKFMADLGFGSMVFFGSILTIALTSQFFFNELEHGTALTLLAKPVWRAEFLIGKFLGAFSIVGVFCVGLAALLAGALYVREGQLMERLPDALAHGRSLRYGDILLFGLAQWLKFGVLSMIVLVVASFARSRLFAVISSVLILTLCHGQSLLGEMYGEAGSIPLRVAVKVMGWGIPNFQLFHLGEQVVEGQAIRLIELTRIGIHGLAYMGVFGGLAVWNFRRREL